MNSTKNFKKFTVLLFTLFAFAANYYAQTAKFSEPKQEKLLNNLKLLVWNEPSAEKVSVKMRIHSGSAFDPQNKEGVMALLGDVLFPNDAQKEFFAEDLGGSLEVTSNYDYIQINATAKSELFLEMLETLAQAVTNPQIDKEITAKVRVARLEKVKELEKSPAYIADQTVAKRLFGDFPYGRAQAGTSLSLEKIDFADLILARQRFLTSDNATITIVGSVKPDLAYRAVRRYFGSWTQADKKIPSTFRQPDAPQTDAPISISTMPKTSEFRFAMRGLARNDKDFYASRILEIILQNRLRLREGEKAFVRHEAHILPSFYIFGISGWSAESVKKDAKNADKISVPETDNYQRLFLKAAVKPEEFDRAKTAFLAEFDKTDAAEIWLDADTFKLSSVKIERQNARGVTMEDAQKVLEKLRKEAIATTFLYTPAS